MKIRDIDFILGGLVGIFSLGIVLLVYSFTSIPVTQLELTAMCGLSIDVLLFLLILNKFNAKAGGNKHGINKRKCKGL